MGLYAGGAAGRGKVILFTWDCYDCYVYFGGILQGLKGGEIILVLETVC